MQPRDKPFTINLFANENNFSSNNPFNERQLIKNINKHENPSSSSLLHDQINRTHPIYFESPNMHNLQDFSPKFCQKDDIPAQKANEENSKLAPYNLFAELNKYATKPPIENMRQKLNGTPFQQRSTDQLNDEQRLKKLRRQSKSINKESNQNKNENLQQKVSSLQEELFEKFGQAAANNNNNNQNLNLFDETLLKKKSSDSFKNVRRSLNFDNLENELESHKDSKEKIEILNKNLNKNEEIIQNLSLNQNKLPNMTKNTNNNINIMLKNGDNNYKKIYDSVFCVKCLDHSNTLFDFHKKFMGLLDEVKFFEEKDINEETKTIKQLITCYLQKITEEISTDKTLLQNSSKILDNIKILGDTSKSESFHEENLLDKSLKEKLNRMSDIVKFPNQVNNNNDKEKTVDISQTILENQENENIAPEKPSKKKAAKSMKPFILEPETKNRKSKKTSSVNKRKKI